MVHLACPMCPVTHPSGVVLTSDEDFDETRSVAEVFEGRDVPAELAALRTNVFKCPVRGRLFPQRDLRQVYLRKLSS
jgi:hypothetical protein